MWSSLFPNRSVTTFAYSCKICDRSYNFGDHQFCVVSGIMSVGGFNAGCGVSRGPNNEWIGRLRDNDDSSQTTSCSFTCFNKLANPVFGAVLNQYRHFPALRLQKTVMAAYGIITLSAFVALRLLSKLLSTILLSILLSLS